MGNWNITKKDLVEGIVGLAGIVFVFCFFLIIFSLGTFSVSNEEVIIDDSFGTFNWFNTFRILGVIICVIFAIGLALWIVKNGKKMEKVVKNGKGNKN